MLYPTLTAILMGTPPRQCEGCKKKSRRADSFGMGFYFTILFNYYTLI